MTAERDKGVTGGLDIEAEYARLEATWDRWLQALSVFAAETDPYRAAALAAEAGELAPAAIDARLMMLRLLPVVIRLREHRVMPLRFVAPPEQ